MNILLASSEVFPFSKTGGLADMVGALARAQALIVVPPDVTRVEGGDSVAVLDLLRDQL